MIWYFKKKYLNLKSKIISIMGKRIIECVPNFSEGRDKEVISQITAAIEAAADVRLLDVDPGEATNRTVVTFAGEPEAVVEAASYGCNGCSSACACFGSNA